MKRIVLLPTYNEAGNLLPMLDAIRAHLPAADILVIDDNSPDGTGRSADEAAAADPRVQVAHRPGKQGLGVAYRFGYRRALDAGYDRVFQIDCDFSHDPADLPRIDALLDAHPVVVGSRRVAGGGTVDWPWYRNAVSGFGSLYARLVLGARTNDLTTGFKGFRAEALRALPLDALLADGFGFQVEVTAMLEALGIAVHEMPIRFADRKVGQSKMSLAIFVEALTKVWRIRAEARRALKARLGGG